MPTCMSMIEVTKWCFHGSIKCCRLNDPLLRWLAIHEAKEKRFVRVCHEYPGARIISDLYNAKIEIRSNQVKSDYSLGAKKIGVAQLADASCIFDFGMNFPLGTVLKSVRVLEIDYTRSTQQMEEEYQRAVNNRENIRYAVVKNSTLSPENFDRLVKDRTWCIRHLSLRNTKVREIAKLPEHLETLDVGGTLIETLPEETHINLETLLLKGTKIREIPRSFPYLKYLDVRDTFVRSLSGYLWHHLKSVRASDTFEHLVGPPAGNYRKIETLKTVHVQKTWKYELPKFSYNLTKLGLSSFKNAAIHHNVLNWDVIIELLCTLEHLSSLKIQGSNVPARIIDVATYPHGMRLLKDLWIGGSNSRFILSGIKLPSSLITITLENLEFKKDPMIILEKLQHLETLRLRWLWYTAQTKKMTCSTGKFPQLEMLQLYHISGLEEWSVQQGALPKITHVVIQSCKALKDLSDSLIDRTNPLKELGLISMPPGFTSRFSKLPFVKIPENQI